MSKRPLFATALLALLLSFPSEAIAQDRAAARADFRAGVTALEAGDFAEAEAAFRRSIDTYPTTAARCNLALTYDRWGRIDDAIAAYHECAENDSTSSGHYGSHASERAAELTRERDAAHGAPQPTQPSDQPLPTPEPATPVAQPVLAPTSPTQPDAPAAMTYRQEAPAAAPSRVFLRLGITSTLLGGVGIAAGAGLATSASSDADDLARAGYPVADGRYLIPVDDPGADTLRSAQSKSSASVGLYVAGGVLAALGVTFFILQATTASGSEIEMAAGPVDGGAAVSVRRTF